MGSLIHFSLSFWAMAKHFNLLRFYLNTSPIVLFRRHLLLVSTIYLTILKYYSYFKVHQSENTKRYRYQVKLAMAGTLNTY